jgi:hypothetical protein
MFLFGAGETFAIPLVDASGNTISNPTPIRCMTQQSASLDFSADTKELYGQNQFAVDVARGKAKISGKISMASVFGRAINALFFSQSVAAGTMSAINVDLVGSTIATTVTPTIPGSGTYTEDLGVIDTNGIPYVRVASAPATGQYSLSGGVYTFAAADVGKTAFINYRYSYTLAGSQNISLTNLAMGASPTLSVKMQTSYQGKRCLVSLNRVVFTKLGLLGTKLDDYSIPELEFSAFADGANQVGNIYVSE